MAVKVAAMAETAILTAITHPTAVMVMQGTGASHTFHAHTPFARHVYDL